MLTAGEVLMTDFKTFGEACGELIRGWEKKMTETKRCTKCGRELPLSEFYRDDAHSDGRQSCCRGVYQKNKTGSISKKCGA